MKQNALILIALFIFFSCSQDKSDVLQPDYTLMPKLTLKEAQQSFAKILSKAVYDSKDVRIFLKEQALAQFDNDYDIFYPFVKDKEVTNDVTFRDLLLSYCSDENELIEIEESLLMLNILVPDLSWICDFNPRDWDVEDEEVAVLCKDDETNTLYGDGESLGNLPLNEIPGFPCLRIKNNERIKISNGATRSAEAVYEFVDDVFNGELNNVRTRHEYYEERLEWEDEQAPTVMDWDLDPLVIEAWNAHQNSNNICDRDYIYYGITKANPKGVLNTNIRESLLKFKINPAAFTRIADQSGKDPMLGSTSQKDKKLTTEELLKRIWTDGKFEIYFTIYIGNDSTKNVHKQVLIFDLDPRQVFSIDKVNVEYQNKTWFRSSKYTYTVNPANLSARWIYPAKLSNFSTNNIHLQPWDLYNQSSSMHIYVEEMDDSQTIETKETYTFVYSSKSSFETSQSGKDGDNTTTTKKTYEHSTSTTQSHEVKVTTKVGSDNLGSLHLYYNDPIIVKEDGALGFIWFWMHTSNNGTVEAIFAPKRLR